jgi:hypothetical protein
LGAGFAAVGERGERAVELDACGVAVKEVA